jgi:hypothetical protein
MIPLQKGSQNVLSTYSSLENAYTQLIGYANNVRLEDVPFAIKSLKDLKREEQKKTKAVPISSSWLLMKASCIAYQLTLL